MVSFRRIEINELRQSAIPKETPWKTLVLNERFRKKRNGEFSTATSGTERERGFVGIALCLSEPLSKMYSTLNHYFIFY